MTGRAAFAAVTFALVFASAAAAQSSAPVPRPAPRDSAEYRALVARIMAGDSAADFARLRWLYAAMDFPEGPTPPDSLVAHARRAATDAAARAALDSLLAVHFGNVRAHEVAERIYRQRNDSADAEREARIIERIAASITSGRDGRTLETAFLVVGIPEEYTILRLRGVKFESQALLAGCEPAMCDELSGVEEKTGRRVTYYFRLPDP
jgi:hypothetical protein